MQIIFYGELNRFKITMRAASLFHDYTVLGTMAFRFTTRISRCYSNINNLYYFIILGCLPCLRKSVDCWLTHNGTLYQRRILNMIRFLISGLLELWGDKWDVLTSMDLWFDTAWPFWCTHELTLLFTDCILQHFMLPKECHYHWVNNNCSAWERRNPRSYTVGHFTSFIIVFSLITDPK